MKPEAIKEEIKNIGESLKQRRKEMNLSLKEVETSISIRMNYLQAIEEGQVTHMISPVYAQGFIKQYAIFLGLDGEKIIRDNPEIFNRPAKQEFTYGLGTIEMRGNPSSSIRWIPNAVWVGAFALILIVAWYLARFLEVI